MIQEKKRKKNITLLFPIHLFLKACFIYINMVSCFPNPLEKIICLLEKYTVSIVHSVNPVNNTLYAL